MQFPRKSGKEEGARVHRSGRGETELEVDGQIDNRQTDGWIDRDRNTRIEAEIDS